MTKNPVLNLLDYRQEAKQWPQSYPEGVYRVNTFSNTIEVSCGQWLFDREVQAFIRRGWYVNIKAPK